MPVSTSVDVDADAGSVFDLIADVPRMGEWSPECRRCEWIGGASGATIGARFKGHNRHGPFRWSTTGEVVALTPGRELAFDVTFLGLPVARWHYRIEPTGDQSCRVTETWEDRRRTPVMRVLGVVGTGVRDRASHNRAGMEETLRRVKQAAEAG